jgi:hypothetical protein
VEQTTLRREYKTQSDITTSAIGKLGILSGRPMRSAHRRASLVEEVHQFTAVTPLVDHTAESLVFTFQLYHGDDLLVTSAASEPIPVAVPDGA